MANDTTSTATVITGAEDLAGAVETIHLHIGGWQEFGYPPPAAPGSAVIPPLGQRSAEAIHAGHQAVKDIDQLMAQLYMIRGQLVSQLRKDSDIRDAAWDARHCADGVSGCTGGHQAGEHQ